MFWRWIGACFLLTCHFGSACAQTVEGQPIASQLGEYRVTDQGNGFSFSPDQCNVSGGGENFPAFTTGVPVKVFDPRPGYTEVSTQVTAFVTGSDCAVSLGGLTYSHAGSFYLTSGTGGLQEALLNSKAPPGVTNNIILNARWYELVAPRTATEVISSVTGSTSFGLIDITTDPYTSYSWNGSQYVAITSTGSGASFPAGGGLVYSTGTTTSRAATSTDVSSLVAGANISPSLVNNSVQAAGVNGAGIGLAQTAWSGTAAYPQCSAVSSGGNNYLAVAANTDVIPGTNSAIWWQVPNANTPTSGDCAFYIAASQVNGATGAQLVLPPGNTNSCIGFMEPTVTSPGYPNVVIVGAGKHASTLTQTCNIIASGNAVIQQPNAATAYALAGIDWEDFTVNANFLASATINVYGAQQFKIKHLLLENPADGSDHYIEFGHPAAANHATAWTYQMELEDIDTLDAHGPGSGANITASVSGGVPTFTVVSGGASFNPAYSQLILSGTGMNADSPCTNRGSDTINVSGGAITSITTTATGCSSPLYAAVFGGNAVKYCFKFNDASDSNMIMALTPSECNTGVFNANVTSLMSFTKVHPISTMIGISDSGTNSYWATQMDTIYRYGFDFEGAGNTDNIYGTKFEWATSTLPGSSDYHFGAIANPPINSPYAINIFGDGCGNGAGFSGYNHFLASNGAVSGNTLPPFVHAYNSDPCNQPSSIAGFVDYSGDSFVLDAGTSLVLKGSTGGSTTLSASATGGTLDLGSTNATVDSSGNLTVNSCAGCGGGSSGNAGTGLNGAAAPVSSSVLGTNSSGQLVAASASTVASEITGQTITPKQVGQVYLYADQFPGADVGQKINACNAALLAQGGGTCDDRNLWAGSGVPQTISSTVNIGDTSGVTSTNIHHIFPGNAFWTVTITNGTSCAIDQWSGSILDTGEVSGAAGSDQAVIETTSTTNAHALYCTDKTGGWNAYIKAGGLSLRGWTAGATLAELADIEDIVDESWFHDMFIDNNYGNGALFDNVCCGVSVERMSFDSATTAQGGIPLTIGNTGIVQAVTFKDFTANTPGLGLPDIKVNSSIGVTLSNLYIESNGEVDTSTPLIYVASTVNGINIFGGAAFQMCASSCPGKYAVENHSASIDVIGLVSGVGSFMNDVAHSQTVAGNGEYNINLPYIQGGSPAYLSSLSVSGNLTVGSCTGCGGGGSLPTSTAAYQVPVVPTSGSTSYGAQSLNQLTVASVMTYGATGNGTTVDGPAIVAAMTANPTGTVYMPAGTYLLNNSSGATGLLTPSTFTGHLLLSPGAILACNTATTSAGICVQPGAGFYWDGGEITYTGIGSLPLARTSSTNYAFLPVNNTAGLTIANLSVVGSTGPCIWIGLATNVTVRHVSVSTCTADGLHFESSKNVTVDGYTSIGTGDDALAFTSATGNTEVCGANVSKVNITNSKSRGLVVVGGCDVNFSEFTINSTAVSALYAGTVGAYNATSHIKYSNGFVLGSGTYSGLSGNTYGSEIPGAVSYVDINNVYFAGSASTGVSVASGSSYITVRNSTIVAPLAGNGFNIAGCTHCNFDNNRTDSTPGYGFYSTTSSDIEVSNLIVRNAYTGTTGGLDRAFWSEVESGPVSANGVNVVDDQGTATGYVVGDYNNGAYPVRISGLTGTISNGSFTVQADTGTSTAAVYSQTNGTTTAPIVVPAINGLTETANATGFSVSGGSTSKMLTMTNSLTLAGTDGTTMTHPATSTTLAGLSVAQAFTAAQAVSVAGAASTPGLSVTGAPYAGGTATTNFPQLYLNQGAAVTTLSTSGTEFGINAPSGFAGHLINAFVNGGSTRFRVDYAGDLFAAGTGTFTSTLTAPALLPGTLYSAAGTALPACASGIKGQTAVVSDAASPTYMSAYSSGGSITAAVICSYNGSAYSWVTH